MSSLTCVPAQGSFCCALFCRDPQWTAPLLSSMQETRRKECMQSSVTVWWKSPHNVSFPLIRWPLRHPDEPTKYRLTLRIISNHSINITNSPTCVYCVYASTHTHNLQFTDVLKWLYNLNFLFQVATGQLMSRNGQAAESYVKHSLCK